MAWVAPHPILYLFYPICQRHNKLYLKLYTFDFTRIYNIYSKKYHHRIQSNTSTQMPKTGYRIRNIIQNNVIPILLAHSCQRTQKTHNIFCIKRICDSELQLEKQHKTQNLGVVLGDKSKYGNYQNSLLTYLKEMKFIGSIFLIWRNV